MKTIDRDPESGRFAQGNRLASGNPYAKQAAAFRREIMSAVTPEEMRRVIRKLLDEALKGNVMAARELLTRCVGEPVPYDVLARLEELERMVEEAKAWA